MTGQPFQNAGALSSSLSWRHARTVLFVDGMANMVLRLGKVFTSYPLLQGRTLNLFVSADLYGCHQHINHVLVPGNQRSVTYTRFVGGMHTWFTNPFAIYRLDRSPAATHYKSLVSIVLGGPVILHRRQCLYRRDLSSCEDNHDELCR